jgi:hypothetical protein
VTKVTEEFPWISYRDEMKRNMSSLDRIIRVALVALVAVLYFTHVLSPVAAVILGILAVVVLLTSIVGMCPIYMALGISTRKKTAV